MQIKDMNIQTIQCDLFNQTYSMLDIRPLLNSNACLCITHSHTHTSQIVIMYKHFVSMILWVAIATLFQAMPRRGVRVSSFTLFFMFPVRAKALAFH